MERSDSEQADAVVQATDGNGDEEGRQEKRQRHVATKAVRVVSLRGEAAMVEYADKNALPMRVIIPASEVSESGRVPVVVLDAGEPYGQRWETLIAGSVTSQEVAAGLYRRGIWTLADLRAHPTEGRQAFAELASALYRSLLRKAASIGGNEHE